MKPKARKVVNGYWWVGHTFVYPWGVGEDEPHGIGPTIEEACRVYQKKLKLKKIEEAERKGILPKGSAADYRVAYFMAGYDISIPEIDNISLSELQSLPFFTSNQPWYKRLFSIKY